MRILCLLVPHFPVIVEQRDDARLKDRPLILTQDGAVWDGSSEALNRGVRVGMKAARAEKLCPEASVRAVDIPRYELALEKMAGMLAEASPVVEVKQWNEVYADVSDQKISRFCDEAALCQEVGRGLIRDIGLRGMMGVAGDKFTAYVAAYTIGWGRALLLRPGTERAFLAKLPVDILPLHEEMRQELHILGIRSVGQFARLSAGAVVARFGSEGRRAHRLAQGRGQRQLIPYRCPQQVEAACQFEPPLEMDGRLTERVRGLARTGCAQLDHQGLTCQKVHLLLSFEDGTCRGIEQTLEGPTADPAVVGASAQELARSLSRTDRVTEGCLRLIMLQAQRGKQLRLDAVSQPAKVDLGQLVSPLATKFGSDRFYQGRLINSSSPLAELRFAWEGWKRGE